MALKLGILALVDAKPGKEADVEAFVMGGQAIVEHEPGTRVWYGFKVNETTFGIFDASRTRPRARPTFRVRSRQHLPRQARSCSHEIQIFGSSTSSR